VIRKRHETADAKTAKGTKRQNAQKTAYAQNGIRHKTTKGIKRQEAQNGKRHKKCHLIWEIHCKYCNSKKYMNLMREEYKKYTVHIVHTVILSAGTLNMLCRFVCSSIDSVEKTRKRRITDYKLLPVEYWKEVLRNLF
jgi:hypothetical protein